MRTRTSSLDEHWAQGVIKNWPSREEWAQRRRTVYVGDECPHEYYAPYHEMVTAEMERAARAELEAPWRALGPAVRGYRTSEQAGDARCLRREVREALHYPWGVSDDLPSWRVDRVLHFEGRWLAHLPELRAGHPLPACRAYVAGRDEQRRRAEADWMQAVANRPIDDAAWARELAYRAEFERRHDPENCRIRI
jgi:hypothetical protein